MYDPAAAAMSEEYTTEELIYRLRNRCGLPGNEFLEDVAKLIGDQEESLGRADMLISLLEDRIEDLKARLKAL